MKLTYTLIMGIISLLFISVITNAKTYIHEKTKYHTVSGKNGVDIFKKMVRRGPRVPGVKHALAATKGEIKVKRLKTKVRGNKCVIATADVHLYLTYYLPKLSVAWRPSKNVQVKWKRYLDAIIVHEYTHGKFFKQAATSFERELHKAVGKTSDGCRNFGAAAARKLKSLGRRTNNQHAAFDRRENYKNAKVRKLERAFIKAK